MTGGLAPGASVCSKSRESDDADTSSAINSPSTEAASQELLPISTPMPKSPSWSWSPRVERLSAAQTTLQRYRQGKQSKGDSGEAASPRILHLMAAAG